MRKSGTDPKNVSMSDVLCDFCQRAWTETEPMIEGHHGSCLCGRCLTVAYTAVVLQGGSDAPAEYTCPMCLEGAEDRSSMGRGDEPGWQSPLRPEAVLCKRCIELAAKALNRDRDFDWSTPGS